MLVTLQSWFRDGPFLGAVYSVYPTLTWVDCSVELKINSYVFSLANEPGSETVLLRSSVLGVPHIVVGALAL